MLDAVNVHQKLTRRQYDERLPPLQVRLRELHWECFEKRIPAIFVFEGWDAAGKGGAIKRLTAVLDPRGYSVIPIAAPSGDERRHHYLWRFWKQLPKAGHFTIFDRSWYGRVMVERIEGFCPEAAWKRAYREITEFERHLTNFGMVVCKFWLHISKDEQLRRFQQRGKDPYKSYKLTDEDWRNREKWNHYEAAVDEMLERTSTLHAPWTIVEANDKLHARVKVVKTVVDALEKAVGGSGAIKHLRRAEERLAELAKG